MSKPLTPEEIRRIAAQKKKERERRERERKRREAERKYEQDMKLNRQQSGSYD